VLEMSEVKPPLVLPQKSC